MSRTFRSAAWILGLAALAEVSAGSVALVQRARNNPPLTIQVPPPGTAPARGDTFAAVDPFASAASASPAPVRPAPSAPALAANSPAPLPSMPAPGSNANLPKPTPVEERQVTAPESRVDALLAESRALRERGDMTTAITRLREALALSPKNALLITELAGAYEKMGLEDKALEQYRLVYDMGDSAGIYYQLADAKLKAAELGRQQPAPAQTSSSPSSSPGSETATDSVVESGGFQPGSSLALVNLSTVEKPDTADGLKRFTLKIPVKRRPNIKISVADVVIQVFFYDQLGNNDIVRTNASVSSHWSTLPADWQEDDIEILEVDYTQAAPPADAGKIEEGRHYYGYVVCVYYKHDLQDMAADPQALLKKFPPPLTLPEKEQTPP